MPPWIHITWIETGVEAVASILDYAKLPADAKAGTLVRFLSDAEAACVLERIGMAN